MAPSVNELTRYRISLEPGDRFKLHDKGAKELNKRYKGEIEFKDGDVLIYPGYKNLDVPQDKGHQSVWMEKGEDGLQVDVNVDLFSKKIRTK